MVVFTRKDRELAEGAYRDMADAVAAAIARRETALGVVYIAGYMHRFGVDLTAHASRETAERQLHALAARECARNPDLRHRVCARFGAWPAKQMERDAFEALVTDWGDLVEGESLWIAECEVDAGAGIEMGANTTADDLAAPGSRPVRGSVHACPRSGGWRTSSAEGAGYGDEAHWTSGRSRDSSTEDVLDDAGRYRAGSL